MTPPGGEKPESAPHTRTKWRVTVASVTLLAANLTGRHDANRGIDPVSLAMDALNYGILIRDAAVKLLILVADLLSQPGNHLSAGQVVGAACPIGQFHSRKRPKVLRGELRFCVLPMQLYQDVDKPVLSWRRERGKPIDKYALLIVIHREEDLIAAGIYFIIRAVGEQKLVLLGDRFDRSLAKFYYGAAMVIRSRQLSGNVRSISSSA